MPCSAARVPETLVIKQRSVRHRKPDIHPPLKVTHKGIRTPLKVTHRVFELLWRLHIRETSEFGFRIYETWFQIRSIFRRMQHHAWWADGRRKRLLCNWKQPFHSGQTTSRWCGIMSWAGIIADELVYHGNVPDGVKSALRNTLLSWKVK